MITTDLVVLGGGPAGYVAAIQAAKLEKEVILVEEDLMGGTCLNRGCIPTKALLQSASVKHDIDHADEFGFSLKSDYEINFATIQARKEKIVSNLRNGVSALMKKNKIKVLHGKGAVMGPSIFSPVSGTVTVTYEDPSKEETVIVPKNLIIATGSRVKSLPNLKIDEENILSSTGMLEISELPKTVAVIGGGVIGVEFASFLNRMGSKVTVIEYADRLVINESPSISQELKRAFEGDGICVKTSAKVQKAEVVNGGVAVSIEGEAKPEIFDKVLVAVGREPNIDNIGLINTSIKFDKKGIQVNKHYQTAESHIYAIGDAIPTLQLAHVGMAEGKIAVEHLVNNCQDTLDYVSMPRCTYTSPEIASVGYTQADIPEGMKVKVGKFPFTSNGKGMIAGAKGGFVEVLRNEENDDLLGISIIGPHATEMISEGSLARYVNASAHELGEVVHPHPTLSEAIQEAALDSYKMAIHK